MTLDYSKGCPIHVFCPQCLANDQEHVRHAPYVQLNRGEYSLANVLVISIFFSTQIHFPLGNTMCFISNMYFNCIMYLPLSVRWILVQFYYFSFSQTPSHRTILPRIFPPSHSAVVPQCQGSKGSPEELVTLQVHVFQLQIFRFHESMVGRSDVLLLIPGTLGAGKP